MSNFDTILIANRGEIACRVMRSAQKMGYKTVAVYSDADANAPHVKLADQAVHIGASPVGESYLRMDKIIEAAKTTGAGAIHPGYGFLSENADFARACAKADIAFIGPTAEAIEIMGDKARSKRRMIDAGVPCVPGYQGDDQSDKTLIAEVSKIGFPVMVKASAGGGGRGMRLVFEESNLASAITDARSEAKNAFGDDTLLVEKAVMNPRHVEVQVFADTQGNTIHLGERDCSVQRRHQKVLEEAPCPVMTPELRARMGEAAVKAAKDIGYVGAGTVEFLLDDKGEFYFLEMNTRLQVEHPVTEMVTGLDLVALQIKVARGETLGLSQEDITLTGHAIEARLYAEDPAQDFLPMTGPVKRWTPASGDGVRIDSGIETGSEISPFYDPMIAKVIAYGATRNEARQRLIGALENSQMFGVTTNKAFLIDALANPVFADGEATTAFIKEHMGEIETAELSDIAAIFGAVILFETARDKSRVKSLPIPCEMFNWASATKIGTPYGFEKGDALCRVVVTPQTPDNYSVSVGEESATVTLLDRTDSTITLDINGTRHSASFMVENDAALILETGGQVFALTNDYATIKSAADSAGAGDIVAPMHGALIDVFVSEGETVTKGQRLAVLEAMKMQHEILSEVDGTVTAVNAVAGTQVAADTLLIAIEPEEE